MPEKEKRLRLGERDYDIFAHLMKYRIDRFFCVLGFLTLIHTTAGAAPPAPPPTISGSGHLLLDMASEQVIAAANADSRLEPASLTKIMTAYVVFREIDSGHIALDDETLVSEKAWRTGGSRMFIDPQMQVSVEDLLRGMVIQSGNDASVALAEHVAGSEEAFASLMNHHAEQLGLTGTHFVNSTGLPDKGHYTTARDIVRVARALIKEFPEYYRWYSEKKFTYNDITQYNSKKLMWRDESVDGIKTGHTESAGPPTAWLRAGNNRSLA